MCGISGIVYQQKEGFLFPKDEIEKMNHLIAHRGPDSEGYYYDNNVAFGHKRLSILDLSELGHQPMKFLDDYIITYNGEIYNYIELREQLREKGYKFISDTDTEVILAAYSEWGENCVNYFNGMWSFCIHDKKKNILFCSRDRFGIKPFHYAVVNNKFVFGSEIKQILFHLEENILNPDTLVEYLLSATDFGDKTFFKEVYRLPQSHNLIYDLKDNKYEIKRYFSIKFSKEINALPFEEAFEGLEALLKDAVKIRLRSDVKVGTSLSGGLDSSIIASMAAEIYESEERFTGIHSQSSEKSGDESHYAKAVSDNANLDLKVIKPEKKDFFDHLENVIRVQEEPFPGPSIFMQHFVFRKAKEEQCTVMLDGQGADEVLLGYHYYYPHYLKSVSLSSKLRIFKEILSNSDYTKSNLIKLFFYYSFPSIRKMNVMKKYKFINKKYLKSFNKDLLHDLTRSYEGMFDLHENEIYSLSLPPLLRYEDRNSMNYSIESRLPFLDYRLVEYALSIKDSYKIHEGWTKYILRKVGDEILPKEVTWRKDKIGFKAPDNSWLSSKRDGMIEEIHKSKILKFVLNEIPRNMDDRMLWKLYNIYVWEDQYDVKVSN